ncbi:hypothetical protein ACLOJK_024410 [Asimina triloba]
MIRIEEMGGEGTTGKIEEMGGEGTIRKIEEMGGEGEMEEKKMRSDWSTVGQSGGLEEAARS